MYSFLKYRFGMISGSFELFVFVVVCLFFFYQMLYTSSALSLYFPYDFCLSSDTDALTTFGLKFIPPAIAFLMSLCVAVGVYADR